MEVILQDPPDSTDCVHPGGAEQLPAALREACGRALSTWGRGAHVLTAHKAAWGTRGLGWSPTSGLREQGWFSPRGRTFLHSLLGTG